MKKLIFILLLTFMVSKTMEIKAQTLIYPETEKVDVKDSYFGTTVEDPYRWLEDDNSEDTKQWVKAQNKVTQSFLDQIPYREKIKNRLSELYDYERVSSPIKIGKKYIFYKNDGLQNQSILFIQEGLEGTPKVFLDPNTLSKDGTVSVNLAGISKDNAYLAFTVSTSGSDWTQIWVYEVESGKKLDDVLKWVKFSGASWYKNGFFYSRYDEPSEEDRLSGKNENMKVYYHTLGQDQSEDKLIYEDPQHPNYYYGASVTEDEQWLMLSIMKGTSGNEVYVKSTQRLDDEFVPIIQGFENDSYVVGNDESTLFMYTNVDAPNYRLVGVDATNPTQPWNVIIPEKAELLESVSSAGGKLFARYLKDVTHRVYQLDEEGNLEREIELPTLGSASGFGGRAMDTELFYTFTSFTYPPSVFKYSITRGKSSKFIETNVNFDPTDYETKQVFYSSKDGTKIPMFIVHKKGLKLDGERPTYLYAYGGFNISLSPSFSPSRFVLLENGGVFALANIRGGGEYGEKWHKEGMLENKQNVFDDFIAAGEFLIDNNYTDSNHLAIAGGSNGGLLVGACMTQRPDLFKVAFPAVGVLDMLRYHKFTIGWAWATEYGTSEESEASFKNLLAYSPLHNIKEGVSYPATMVTTADHDDRVVPAHSFKFISELQSNHSGNNPVLIRIEEKAGHGAGKPISKTIQEQADIWSFMLWNMRVSSLNE